MIKEINEYSVTEQMLFYTFGLEKAIERALNDKELYKNRYALANEELTNYEIDTINTLRLLSNLGFSGNELGTFIYKDLIMYISKMINECKSRNDSLKCRDLIEDLRDKYSDIYKDFAKKRGILNIDAMHSQITKAFSKINIEKINRTLYFDIYGDQDEENDYGLQLFRLAAYTQKKYSFLKAEMKENKKAIEKSELIDNFIKTLNEKYYNTMNNKSNLNDLDTPVEVTCMDYTLLSSHNIINDTDACGNTFKVDKENVIAISIDNQIQYYEVCPNCGFIVELPSIIFNEEEKNEIKEKMICNPRFIQQVFEYSEKLKNKNKSLKLEK